MVGPERTFSWIVLSGGVIIGQHHDWLNLQLPISVGKFNIVLFPDTVKKEESKILIRLCLNGIGNLKSIEKFCNFEKLSYFVKTKNEMIILHFHLILAVIMSRVR